jgi:Cys-tRNA(Pro)/Cys-tRNA(Cys) deacylase
MRFLDMHRIPYEIMRFPTSIHSATGVATFFNLPANLVYKTLVVIPLQGKPILLLIASDRRIHLRQLARALGIKRLRMATRKEAESLTGLKVGGISPLALHHRGFQVYIDQPAVCLDKLLVSAGQRGVNLYLKATDLIHITGATIGRFSNLLNTAVAWPPDL